jgi:hypothetical protein
MKAPVFIVGAVLAGTIALITTTMISTNRSWDADTEISGAKYDGAEWIKALGHPPGSRPADFLLCETGPRRRSLANQREGWVKWTQPWHSTNPFSQVLEWHQERLVVQGWKDLPTDNPASVQFQRGQWTFELLDESVDGASRYVVTLDWQRSVRASHSTATVP